MSQAQLEEKYQVSCDCFFLYWAIGPSIPRWWLELSANSTNIDKVTVEIST